MWTGLGLFVLFVIAIAVVLLMIGGAEPSEPTPYAPPPDKKE